MNHNGTALLLIDVVGTFDFPGGEQLLEQALPIAACISTLKYRAKAAQVPVIYVNDHYGDWHSNFQQLTERCLAESSRGRAFVKQLVPESDDYAVLKPKHSGFFQTPLETLLKHLDIQRLILAGLCTNSCILFTAQDAYMREFELFVPKDCVASYNEEQHQTAIRQMRSATKADVSPSTQIHFD